MLRAVIISADSHPTMKFEIFERLNTGSIVLRPQELRNSIYRGPFNDLLHELIHIDSFRLCIGTKEPRRRMVDQELALRFFALREHLTEYKPPLKQFLNDYMAGIRSGADESVLVGMRTLFQHTTSLVADVLGSAAFRQLDSSGSALDRAPNRALFDAQMLAFSWVEAPTGAINRDQVLGAISGLFENVVFIDASTLATGDRSRTLLRVQLMIEALETAGLSLNAPDIAVQQA